MFEESTINQNLLTQITLFFDEIQNYKWNYIASQVIVILKQESV